jgi:iron(III) transport system ATP-binding protein
MVFQDYALFPHMDVSNNVAYGLRLRKLPKGEIKKRVRDVLDLLGIEELANRSVGKLSGGQQQRVALARALVVNPEVLLFDEPLSNLDANLRVRVRTEIRRIQKKLGITAVYVTHDQEEALSISDKIVVMKDGEKQQEGTPLDIYFKPANEFVARFVGIRNFVRGRVIDVLSNKMIVDIDGMTLSLNPYPHIKPGDHVLLTTRMESIRISKAPLKGANVLKGKIVSVSFEGPVVKYFVDVNGKEWVVSARSPSPSSILWGEVYLKLNKSELHAIRE